MTGRRRRYAPGAWFERHGWKPFPFQREVWSAMAAGRSGLLHATTGAGKTYAVWFGALARAAALGVATDDARQAPPLGVLWLTPMRALAADTTRSLTLPLAEEAPAWTIGQRTGDTASAERARQDRRLPTALVTTPESLTLMLTRASAQQDLAGVHTVIVDEWHELLGNKRGVQVQLALARLRHWNPQLVVWGLSATLGNSAEAMATLVGDAQGQLVVGRVPKDLAIDTLLPADVGRFSWGGHLGAQMQMPVVEEIERSGPTLVFTNVRSQAEAWYQLLLAARPDWAGLVALHHGSLDKSVREWVELGLKEGRLRAVVATSSLDLGVDFLPVERVLQIGSAKGVARLLQRAGRSGHAPGRPSRVTLVPTQALELVEGAAARRAAKAGQVEGRHTPAKPLDVLVQHLVTVALGGGFTPDALYEEVRSAPAYATLTREEFDWALAFVEGGGSSLGAYPEYHRVLPDEQGVYRVPDAGIARRHRMGVGTIVSDSTMPIQWVGGGVLGHLEESFIARLNPGDCFIFGGRALEYVRTRDMTAYVRKASSRSGKLASWNGAKMPLSSELADAIQALLHQAAREVADTYPDGLPEAEAAPPPARKGAAFSEPELRAAWPMLQVQVRLSHLPQAGRLLVEQYRSREGHHLFVYPFGGRNVHLGLAQLLAWRFSQQQPNTFSISINDYGFELLSIHPVEVAPLLDGRVLAEDGLMHDMLASLNSSALARKRFREIARVAGLVFSGFPGAAKSTRQLQASSSLFYEVFRKYDAGNRLLSQAEHEVLAQELELGRLGEVLARMRAQQIDLVPLQVPTPMSLPLMVERFREQLSTEKLADRLARIVADAEKVLAHPPLPPRPRLPKPRIVRRR